jgi:hypothetical protein
MAGTGPWKSFSLSEDTWLVLDGIAIWSDGRSRNSNALTLINEMINENGKCILNGTRNKLEIETLDSRII